MRAKTDPIDTKMILAFAKSKALSAMEAPSETCTKLAALLDRRGHLVEQLAREKNRLQNSEKLIQSIQGVGKITAWTLLAYLTEIEHLNRNRLVALAGIAPFNRDSGKFSGKRSIIGGRAKVRRCLYMATQSAANCNPIISAYVQRLRERGKPYKCAIVAAMRKLLLHIQSLIKNSKLSPL